MSISRLKVPNSEVLVNSRGNIIGMSVGGRDTYFPHVVAVGSTAKTLTGTTAKTRLDSCVIPAGSMPRNGGLRLSVFFSTPGGGSNKAVMAEIGDPNTTGVDMLQSITITNTSHWGIVKDRLLLSRGGTLSSQVMVKGDDFSGFANAFNTQPFASTLDFSKDQELVFYGQLVSSADTLVLQHWMVESLPNIGG